MSRKLKAEDIKVGMLVRVGRKTGTTAHHHLPSGAVCAVERLGGWWGGVSGRVLVNLDSTGLTADCRQSVAVDQLSRAPQATKKAAK